MKTGVIRRIALRGSATEGIALSRADLVPEVTITAEGVHWHPSGEQRGCRTLLVTRDIFPLFEAVFCGSPGLRPAKANTRISWQESLNCA